MSARGSVKRYGASWCYVIEVPPVNGKRRQVRKRGFATSKQATGALNVALGEIEGGNYVRSSRMTFGKFLVDRWLPAIASTIRATTLRNYRALVEGNSNRGLAKCRCHG